MNLLTIMPRRSPDLKKNNFTSYVNVQRIKYVEFQHDYK